MSFPRLLLVRQNHPDRRILDIPAEVRKQLAGSALGARLQPGSRIAIGAGSRGVSNIAVIVKTVVEWWKERGMSPFVFPAMGSHGGATAEGQAGVLAKYGITAESMDCPIVSQLEVVPLGRTAEGIETFMDRAAYESDGVMLVGRVKWHTDFIGKVESGIFKMMAIGTGKLAGAKNYHTHGFRMGLGNVILSVGRKLLETGKFLGGLAILEDAYHNTAKLVALEADGMEDREAELLKLVKSWAARIPVAELDLLIVNQFGKNISGSGFDTVIVNRSVHDKRNFYPNAPIVHRLYARDITSLSYGNAVGIGQADILHARIIPKIDWNATRINSLTASSVPAIRTPISLPTDRDCIEAVWDTTGRFHKQDLAIGWIRNTLALTTLALSENLRPEIESDARLEILGEPKALEFDAAGELVEVLPG